MDDSSMFLQWAMNQLHQHPSSADADAASAYPDTVGGGSGGGAGDGEAAFPSLQALRNSSQPPQTATAAGVRVRDLTVQVDHRTNSWSSGDSPGAGASMDHDAAAGWSPHTARARATGLGSGSNSSPMSWNFSAASAQPTDESGIGVDVALPHASAARRVGSAGPAAAAAASSPGPVQDHIMAERRRREKINQRFIELSTVIPGLKKMDKATILGDAVKYVRELQEKVKTLEEERHHDGSSMQSAVLVKKPCRLPDDEGTASGSNGGLQPLPEIEARLWDKSVLLRIHCDNARGLLVNVLSEVEKMSLAITHTNVMPFPASTAIITITAKVEEGFNATVDEIVRRINSVLHQHYSSSTTEPKKLEDKK
ncbi:transcription factor bHLH18-like [Phragmites australis]|uniref:transcription factor bHLH18-like n=1 Tax=Phragmites australis TaxID=29695 RepID=UPI002D79BFC6|nr:transcription factor bHLH18-like [Phragmites australis]